MCSLDFFFFCLNHTKELSTPALRGVIFVSRIKCSTASRMSFKDLLNNLLIWFKFHKRSFKTFYSGNNFKLIDTEQTTKKNRTKNTHITIIQIHLFWKFTPYVHHGYHPPSILPHTPSYTHTLIYTQVCIYSDTGLSDG